MTQNTSDTAPNADSLLEDLAGEATDEGDGSSLDDLYNDAMLHQAAKNPKSKRAADPSVRNALDATAKRMRELYTLPENWQRTRGVALIDKGTSTLVGNFSEYVHISLPGTRKLIREHTPISIEATEIVDGYLGEQLEQRIKGRSWSEKHALKADLWMDELMVGAPGVSVTVCKYLGSISRVDLEADTQFASASGNTQLMLPAGTDVYGCLSTDTRNWLRKQVSG